MLCFYTVGSAVGLFTPRHHKPLTCASHSDVTTATTSLGRENSHLHFNLTGPPSSTWSVVDETLLWQMTVLFLSCHGLLSLVVNVLLASWKKLENVTSFSTFWKSLVKIGKYLFLKGLVKLSIHARKPWSYFGTSFNYWYNYFNKYRDCGNEGTKKSLEGSTFVEDYVLRGRS